MESLDRTRLDPAQQGGARAATEPPQELRRLGEYRILRRVGEGVQVIARRHEQSGFDAIMKRLDATGAREPSPQEAGAYGRALVKLSPSHALDVMTKWVRPPGMLSRITPTRILTGLTVTCMG